MPQTYSPKEGWRVYIIKGGAGSGKSTFMRRVAKRVCAADSEVAVEEILCSSDPQSLDGVIFQTRKVAIFDGTAPHVLEPRYWGSCEVTVDICGCADNTLLRRRAAELIALTDACADCHGRCRQFMGAAAAMLADSRRIALACTDTDKVRRTAERIAAREFAGGSAGGEQQRFLSAVTPQGQMVLYSTLQALCERVYVIEDEYGAAGALLMDILRERALAAGEELITCRCPLSPHDKVEHLILPARGVGFTLANPFHRADFPVHRRIHASRFTDEEALRTKRQRLAFNRRSAREMLAEAAEAARAAKAVHDQMEQISVAAMDFAAVDALCEQVCEDILAQM